MKRIFLCFAALLVAGCQSTSYVPQETAETRAARELSNQRMAECKKPQSHRTMTSLQHCLNEAEAIGDVAFSDLNDILRLRRAQLLIVAEQFDKKKITLSQYELLRAQIDNQTLNAADRRLTSMYGGKPTRHRY